MSIDFIEPEVPTENSEWECHCFGAKDNEGIIWCPTEGKVPNWFWRKMQYLILANRWVKVQKNV